MKRRVLLFPLMILVAGCSHNSVQNPRPTISPADIQIEAMIKPASTEVTALLPTAHWELDITLDSHTEKPLRDGEVYFFDVYPFVLTHEKGPVQYLKGEHFGNPGTDGRTLSSAVKALKDAGYLPQDWPETRSSYAEVGFTVTGAEFPVSVRYPLIGENPPAKAAVVYSHYEYRAGSDLSWTKVFYVNP